MNTPTTLFATCLAIALAVPLPAQAICFFDSFEGPTLDPFWTPFTQSGSITFPSTTQVHGGAQAVQFDSVVIPGVNKAIRLTHAFSTPTYGTLSVWMFDTGATAASSNSMGFGADSFSIFTADYNLGPTTGGSYVYNLPAGLLPPGPCCTSGVLRTTGWHLFRIASTPNSLTLSIDGTTIYNTVGNYPFTDCRLFMGAPDWRPAFSAYFDDFSFIEFGAAPATYSLFGSGCVGSNGTPTIGAPPVGPRIGSTLEVPVSSLPVVSGAFGMLGLSNSVTGSGLALPLPLDFLGMPGCQLLHSAEVIEFLGNRPTPTTALWSWTIPTNAALVGVDFYQQVLVVDPGVNAFNAVTSNAGHGTIGC